MVETGNKGKEDIQNEEINSSNRSKSVTELTFALMDDANKLRLQVKKYPHYATFRNFLILFLYFTIGSIAYWQFEGWSVATTLGFTLVSITTIGYGYNVPTSDSSRLFTIFYDIFGLCFVIGIFSQAMYRRLNKIIEKYQKDVDPHDIASIYRNNMLLFTWSILAILLCILVGGIILMAMEDWTFIQGVYFALETSATIGYGDLEIKNGWTHFFLACYIIFSTTLFGFALSNLSHLREKERDVRRLEDVIEKRKDLSFLQALDEGQGLSREKFVLALLEHFGVLDKERDVQPWLDKFDKLDKKRLGKVFKEDLAQFTMTERITAVEEGGRLEQDAKLMPIPLQSFYQSPLRTIKKTMSFRSSSSRPHFSKDAVEMSSGKGSSVSSSSFWKEKGSINSPLLNEMYLHDIVDKVVEIEEEEEEKGV